MAPRATLKALFHQNILIGSWPHLNAINGDFTQPRRQRRRKLNVTWKYKFVLPVLLCAYSNLFNFCNVAELSSNRTGGNGLQVSTENENLLSSAHALHKTLNLGISGCCLVEDGDEMYPDL